MKKNQTFDIYYEEDFKTTLRLGEGIIGISYHANGCRGRMILNLDAFFPANFTQMRRLMNILQIGDLPEIEYLIEIHSRLIYIREISPYWYTTTMKKRLDSNIKTIEERMIKIRRMES